MRGLAKTSPESTDSNKLSTRQPPAPIFLSDLITAPDRHIWGLYGHKNPEKSWNFKTAISKPLSIWKNK